jgi:hypothetical protein
MLLTLAIRTTTITADRRNINADRRNERVGYAGDKASEVIYIADNIP